MSVLSVQSRNEIPPRPKKSRVQVKIKLMCSLVTRVLFTYTVTPPTTANICT